MATVTASNLIATPPVNDSGGWQHLASELQEWFGIEFSIWTTETSSFVHTSSELPGSDDEFLPTVVAGLEPGDKPQILDEENGIVLLAIPLRIRANRAWVAVGPFVTQPIDTDADLEGAQRILAADVEPTRTWVANQTIWDRQALLKVALAVSAKMSADQRAKRLEREVEKVSDNLASTYEEISLLYGVTQNLRLTSTDEEIGKLALDWLIDCIPADGVALQIAPPLDDRSTTFDPGVNPDLLAVGECPVDAKDFTRLVAMISAEIDRWPFVGNMSITQASTWAFPNIRQIILAPLREGDKCHGWIAAFNRSNGDSFDSMEANLLHSVAAILGIHSGNHELYREQSNFMANVVRALTSAIDAKDPYTSGHSDRVARMSVRLARTLGCDRETLRTMYMSGLLHDIGKIGIEDSVLRKPGRLTEAEFEHIKLHPQLGYNILVDLKQFSEVLPIVLHHHEQWDGEGYPHGLAKNEIPFMARICAVADSYDAMTSDRPYRRGISVAEVETIFQEGAGQQWDPDVIAAYFETRSDIYRISQQQRERVSLDFQQWA